MLSNSTVMLASRKRAKPSTTNVTMTELKPWPKRQEQLVSASPFINDLAQCPVTGINQQSIATPKLKIRTKTFALTHSGNNVRIVWTPLSTNSSSKIVSDDDEFSSIMLDNSNDKKENQPRKPLNPLVDLLRKRLELQSTKMDIDSQSEAEVAGLFCNRFTTPRGNKRSPPRVTRDSATRSIRSQQTPLSSSAHFRVQSPAPLDRQQIDDPLILFLEDM
jgi:hypothetical protein